MKVLEILALEEWVGVHPLIDVAKGLNEIPQSKKDKRNQKRRKKAWQ